MHRKEYRSLTIPRLSWNKETLTRTFGELTAQPLEPGFGITFGNALRRLLLGGVEGSAVTAVIIKGINNEFSALPGIVEDTMQVLLNIKEIVVRNKTGKSGKMVLNITHKDVATVADIECDEHLELINKDLIIAHIAQGGSLHIEFFVDNGRGYQPAQWPLGQALQEDGKIYLDAMFSPVRKVTYDVEKTRVGKEIDYDKLILSIHTDGTETPTEVLHYAVSVMRTQLEHFLINPEIPFNEISAVPVEEKNEALDEDHELGLKGVAVDILLKPIDVLEFSVRAHNCLINAGIKRIIDLVNLSEDKLLNIKNFGSKSFDEVIEGMKAFGLSLGMNIKEADLKKLHERTEHESSKR
ncbi:MAG: DNA-directed RNA polymerase subunit alpha [Candidatus Babeliaceae bacterium]|jgi:DNA-directed RNA polymerase subunit alpha